MSEIVISLEHVSKCYKRYTRPADRLKEVLLPTKSQAQEFWALKDIDLEVSRGEYLGIIGRNGSGKSTLLQIIAKTLTPTTGSVYVQGRLSALLELGSGFNPEFTGRQNVFFNGRILGLKEKEIQERFEKIAAFADIGDFMEEPVKSYSSGMFVRLAFSVAVHVEPEILIVDEALAVGDIFFQQKCFQYLERLRVNGTAILFVSHDTQAIVKLCDRAILLQDGHLIESGKPLEVVDKYTQAYYSQFIDGEELKQDNLDLVKATTEVDLRSNSPTSENFVVPKDFIRDFTDKNRYGSTIGLIDGVSLSDVDGKLKSTFFVNEEIVLSVKVNPSPENLKSLSVGFTLKNRLGQVLIATNTCMLSFPIPSDKLGQSFICQFKLKPNIAPNKYTIDFAIAESKQDTKMIYDWINNAATIDIVTQGKMTQAGLCFPEILVSTS
ncbi:MAG: ABC transporter ATP-binding protein [Cyanobacteria bacterium P01_A01_bin.45]